MANKARAILTKMGAGVDTTEDQSLYIHHFLVSFFDPGNAGTFNDEDISAEWREGATADDIENKMVDAILIRASELGVTTLTRSLIAMPELRRGGLQ